MEQIKQGEITIMKKTITKIFAGLLCVVLFGSVMCGCTTVTAHAQKDNAATFEVSEYQFEKITTLTGVDMNTDAIIINSHYFTYYRCKLTDVMYIAYCESVDTFRFDHITGFTAMMKADGTPMLYDEWIELLKANEAATKGVEPIPQETVQTTNNAIDIPDGYKFVEMDEDGRYYIIEDAEGNQQVIIIEKN